LTSGWPNSRKFGFTVLPERVKSIDETNREHHIYLEPADRCFFFGEYFAHHGYDGGGTNQLIINFKCRPSVAAESLERRRYKERAMDAVAAGLRKAFVHAGAERMTWVPVPPSKVCGHVDHDDRLVRTLARAFRGCNADVRPLLRQSASTESDHNAGSRMTPDALHALTVLDDVAFHAKPLRATVALFDDVLTTGKHFKCCERRLRDLVPVGVPIVGIFIARRVPSAATAGVVSV
jgi:hypothetical protein